MTAPAATNNLHRGLALITSAARAQIEEGARHAFRRRTADRCVLDVSDPTGPGLAAVGAGHVSEIAYLTYSDQAVVVQEASDLP
ncbi:encapsulin [Streptomyces sp. NPDC057565]|uniref:encapsulin n=1 Tax=Streptomyces sp. NPDC057565 TaxID=3346169 RepID=UPI00368247E4